ncbi:MAG: response regulator [Proteobacteria bacterium]|nr:response regulator [Pseudomonadota bacterium]
MTSYRVLIAEDDYRVSGIWKEFTEKIPGFEVVKEVRDGKHAYEFMMSNPVDLLIMDVYMPEMDGLGLIQKLRARDRAVDILVISAAKETDIIQRFIRMGVFDYIIKPCVFERFSKALSKFTNLQLQYKKAEVEQVDLDIYFYGQIDSHASIDRDLPKGLQQITMDKINQFFEENPFSQSADEISGKTGLSIATVQRYLRHLTQKEVLKKELTYGSKGRPENKYSLL